MPYLTYRITPNQPKQLDNQLDYFAQLLSGETVETRIETPDAEKDLNYTEFFTIVIDAVKDTDTIKQQVNQLMERIPYFAASANEYLNLDPTMKSFYSSFKIPKRNGKFRQIDAPNESLKTLLRSIKDFLQNVLYVLPHNAAHAYVPHRSTLSALKKHQYNQSKWFMKIDLKDFFNSCTEDFIHSQLKQILPFSLLYKHGTPEFLTQINTIVKVALLNGGLPQGTPLSPYLTNLLMVPIDYEIHNLLKNYNKQHFVYTRYADDICITSKYDFHFQTIEREVENILARQSPLKINTAKTRYGSTSGANWNLGLMLNRQNNITLGYREKRDIKNKLHNFCEHPENWEQEDLYAFHGKLAYFLHIEPDYAKHVLNTYAKKYNESRCILESIRVLL